MSPSVDDVLRRRSVGAPAARSTLLTVLGEFLLPRPDGAWQEALIAGLQLLGFTPVRRAPGRRALRARGLAARASASAGARGCASRRRSADLLRVGARRIYGFGGPVSWDGRWLLLVLRVPEQRRELRHRLTTQLAWAGFGSLGGGLWITPHVDREAQVQAEEPAQLLTFRAELGALGGTAAGDRRGLGPAEPARALRAVHRGLRAAAPARTTAPRSPPRPRSCTPGGASRSSTPTSRTTCSRATGRAGAPTTLFRDRHERGRPPLSDTSTRFA